MHAPKPKIELLAQEKEEQRKNGNIPGLGVWTPAFRLCYFID